MRNYIKCLINPTYFLYYFRKFKIEKKFKIKHLIIGIGSSINNSDICEFIYLGDNCQISNCKIGRHTYFNNNSTAKNATIGNFCSIASNVIIGVGNHPTTMVSTHPAFYSNNKGFKTFSDKMYYEENDIINIGNDVWIAEDVKIIGKVTIGNGAIIATGSIVTKDVPAYAIYGGIPARLIKYRFDELTISKLQSIKWWEFGEQDLINNYKDFQDTNLFIGKYYKKE